MSFPHVGWTFFVQLRLVLVRGRRVPIGMPTAITARNIASVNSVLHVDEAVTRNLLSRDPGHLSSLQATNGGRCS